VDISPPRRDSNESFATTRWSMVLGAGGQISRMDARDALAALCDTYWAPLYAYLRRNGSSAADAADTVQGFFALLLERADLAQVSPELGRFRSFLLASLKHFQANERDKQAALKRGGGRVILSFDAQVAENRYKMEPADRQTPEGLFDRQWALTVLERAQGHLRDRYQAAANIRRFDVLLPYLAGKQSESYRDAAAVLGMSEGAVKTAVHRMRKEFGDLIRAEVTQTVASAAEVEGEIGALFEALRN
jgi:DNA-directed RNA polymerase specialized sigma24 family protein